MIDLIAYLAVRLLNKILSFVPISFSLWIGRRLGTFVFLINKKRRLVAYANLKAAFSKEKSPRELKQITHRVYQNMVQTFVEVLNLTKINRGYVDKYIEIVNLERIRNAASSGRGTILLTAHFGDWELSSLTSSVVGYPILVLAREQKMKRLNELLNRLRESNGCKVIRKGMSTKNILKALYGRNIVGILSDQDAGKNGMLVDFFGRPTSSHSGTMEIAKHTDSIILPNFIVRTHGPFHKVYLEKYIDFRETKSSDDIKENLQRFTSLLESYVRKYPDQWLWLHKRWKSTPARTVLVLSDGKAGHLNQSLAVAKKIQEARIAQGYRAEDTKIVVADVKFKNSLSRMFLSSCAAFSSWRCHGCMGCMKLNLENSSYDKLMKTYSDFVISCGSSLEAVNIFMSIENNAKNIIIMKPGPIFGHRKFKLMIMPKHDNPPKAKNIVATTIAPNLINEETLKNEGRRMRDNIRIDNDNVLGLLVGGDNPEYSLSAESINRVISDVLKFCEKHDLLLLATTSRRTPPEVSDALKNKLKNNPQCRLLVIANEKNPDGTVGGLLSLSKMVVTSGESVSMISEAVSSRKKVVVFELEKKNDGFIKHESALKEMEKEKLISVSGIDNLYSALDAAWREDRKIRELRDDEKIFEAVRRLT